MQYFKRVIVEKSHQQSQINRWKEDDIKTYEGMKLVGCQETNLRLNERRQ
jgi:hypothetical protein